MNNSTQRRWIGRGRGVLGLTPGNAQPRPGNRQGGETDITQSALSDKGRYAVTQQQQQQQQQQPVIPAPQRNLQAPDSLDQHRKSGKSLLAKFSYKANATSPLGCPELTVSQGQKLALVEKHPSNEHWWKVEDETGAVGYVPASYMMIQEDKPSTLPWLAEQKPQEIVSEKPVWKPYASAYNKSTEGDEETESDIKKKYYCDVCDKNFNGPKPYGAHMTSKNHREELELANEMGR